MKGPKEETWYSMNGASYVYIRKVFQDNFIFNQLTPGNYTENKEGSMQKWIVIEPKEVKYKDIPERFFTGHSPTVIAQIRMKYER